MLEGRVEEKCKYYYLTLSLIETSSWNVNASDLDFQDGHFLERSAVNTSCNRPTHIEIWLDEFVFLAKFLNSKTSPSIQNSSSVYFPSRLWKKVPCTIILGDFGKGNALCGCILVVCTPPCPAEAFYRNLLNIKVSPAASEEGQLSKKINNKQTRFMPLVMLKVNWPT